jgi:hypothetical protein
MSVTQILILIYWLGFVGVFIRTAAQKKTVKAAFDELPLILVVCVSWPLIILRDFLDFVES